MNKIVVIACLLSVGLFQICSARDPKQVVKDPIQVFRDPRQVAGGPSNPQGDSIVVITVRAPGGNRVVVN